MADWNITAYLLLFAGAAFALVFGSLLLGRLLRPHKPEGAKLEPYECGEPAVGSADIQFDLRFYVVALVFIIFEVELAFFFPWADVFGKVAQGRAVTVAKHEAAELRRESRSDRGPTSEATEAPKAVQEYQADLIIGRKFALAAMADIAVFFGVLLVGFAYVWSRGDLEWVKAMPRQGGPAAPSMDGTFAATSSPAIRR